MTTLASVLSAGAATVAAVLAALTLYATGRRENRKWLRDSLVEHYFNFLTSSFNSAGSRGYQARLTGRTSELKLISARAREAYNDGTVTLTRLRIIAPREVVDAAEKLHLLDYQVSTAALGPDPPPDEATWRALRANHRDARSTLLSEIRKSLGLTASAPIGRLPKEISDEAFSRTESLT